MRPEAARWSERLGLAVGLVALLLGMVFFTSTWISTQAARLAVLGTIEPYALAVHEQLVHNFGLHGTWVQTIHSGYDDAWTWSGHRAGTLIVAAWIYALAPAASTLTSIQIVATALGAVPAALIGRAALRSDWGLTVGAAIYLLHPALTAIVLQDYQDLCFAVPFLVFTLWTMRARHRAWPIVGAMVGVMPREECVPLVVACALLTIPREGRRRWLYNVLIAIVVAGAYAAVVQLVAPISTGAPGQGHDTPAVNAVKTVLAARGPDDLIGLAHIDSFYALLWAPLGALALLSPLTALPGVALLVMHFTVPYGHGVDRSWFGHAHHLAPALPFLLVATIEGLGRLGRFAARWRPGGQPVGAVLAGLAATAAIAWNARWLAIWGTAFHVVWSWTPWEPPYRHPVWVLETRLPGGAVPVVSVRHAVVASDRAVSYTWEESLHDKAPGKGLGAATHLITPRSATDVVAWGMAMPGAEISDELDGYVTITWEAGALDRSGRAQAGDWPHLPEWLPEGFTQDTLPGLPPVRGEAPTGHR